MINEIKRRIAVQQLTWTGDSSATTTIARYFRLCQITVHYDASITNDCTVTVDSGYDSDYDTVLREANNSGGETDNYFGFHDGYVFPAGYEITIACNVGGDNAYAEVYYEGIG